MINRLYGKHFHEIWNTYLGNWFVSINGFDDLLNQLRVILCLQRLNYTLIIWLGYWYHIRWQKLRSIAFKLPTSAWAGQLSNIIKTFWLWRSDFLSFSRTYSSNKLLPIYLLFGLCNNEENFWDFWSILANSLSLLQTKLVTFNQDHFLRLTLLISIHWTPHQPIFLT